MIRVRETLYETATLKHRVFSNLKPGWSKMNNTQCLNAIRIINDFVLKHSITRSERLLIVYLFDKIGLDGVEIMQSDNPEILGNKLLSAIKKECKNNKPL